MPQQLRVGIVGLGYWGPHLLRNFAAQPDGDVRYGCDLKPENLEKVKRHYPAITTTQSYDDLLRDDDLTLIVLATPTSTHYDLARAALNAGKHVLVEKPMTSTAAEAHELVELARSRQRLLFVDHTFVFTPAVERMAALVRRGDLGELLYYDSVRINLGIIQRDSNVLADLAVHDLAILSAVTDLREIRRVAAFGSKHFGNQEEVAHLHLTFASGFHAHISVSWLSPVKIRQAILSGTKAMMTYHDTEPSEKLRVYDRGVDRDETKPDPFFPKYRSGDIHIPALPLTEALSIEAKHVLRCLRGEEAPRVPGEQGELVIRILEIANEALRNGRVMPFPE